MPAERLIARPRGAGFALRGAFHATIRTPDLGLVERWFARVFARPSTRFDTLIGTSPDLLNSWSHSTATVVEDLLISSIDPQAYIRHGTQCYPGTDRPRLGGFGWYVDGIDRLHALVRDLGYPVLDERGSPTDGAETPLVGATVGVRLPMFWLEPETAGLRYQFVASMPFPTDPRAVPGRQPDPAGEDPLGIVRCSHQTVLTAEPKRAVRLFSDVLGGTVIHEDRDDVRGCDSVYLRLAGEVYEFAVPDKGSAAAADMPPGMPRDTHHAITFQVRDLDRAARHLTAHGVRLRHRTERFLLTEPGTSIGVPWGFVTEPVPGDRRGARS